MTAVFPDVGKKLALAILLDTGRAPKLRLFKNNIAVGNATTLLNLTQADFSGYNEVDLSGLSAPAIDGADHGFMTLAGNNFVHNGGATANNIYGWYIVTEDVAGLEALLFCENFPTPLIVAAVPNHVQFDITILDELGT